MPARIALDVHLVAKLFRRFAEPTRLAILVAPTHRVLWVTDSEGRSGDPRATSRNTWRASRTAGWCPIALWALRFSAGSQSPR